MTQLAPPTHKQCDWQAHYQWDVPIGRAKWPVNQTAGPNTSTSLPDQSLQTSILTPEQQTKRHFGKDILGWWPHPFTLPENVALVKGAFQHYNIWMRANVLHWHHRHIQWLFLRSLTSLIKCNVHPVLNSMPSWPRSLSRWWQNTTRLKSTSEKRAKDESPGSWRSVSHTANIKFHLVPISDMCFGAAQTCCGWLFSTFLFEPKEIIINNYIVHCWISRYYLVLIVLF